MAVNPQYPARNVGEMAEQIVAFLVNKSPYGGASQITKYVTAVVEEMAQQIAVETVENTPEIRALIKRYTREVIAEIVDSDPERIVQRAVASAVGEVLAMQRDKLQNNGDDE